MRLLEKKGVDKMSSYDGKPSINGKKKVPFSTKLTMFLISFIIAIIMVVNVNTFGIGGNTNSNYSLTSSTKGTYVIEDLNLKYIYDDTKYEVVNLSTAPYAVVKGDKQFINMLKWSKKKPEFYIDLTGKTPGTYREAIQYKGINSNLTVEIYPNNLDLRVMEQETLKLEPTVELQGTEKLDSNLIVGVPEVKDKEVRIRDIQDRLNQVGQVKAIVDVSDLKDTSTVQAKLKVYDRDGKPLEDINLLDNYIDVTIPIEQKVVIINSKDAKNYVSQSENKMTKKKHKTSEDAKEKATTKKDKKETSKQEKPTGSLTFKGLKKGYDLENLSKDLEWKTNIVINVSTFKEGTYRVTVKDEGVIKNIKFKIVDRAKKKATNNSKNDKTPKVDKDKPKNTTPNKEDVKDTKEPKPDKVKDKDSNKDSEDSIEDKDSKDSNKDTKDSDDSSQDTK